MAVIPTSLAYVDAAVLDTALHNTNIFSATGSEGILSEPNGGLEVANLAGGFAVRAEHIWPEEVIRVRQEGGTERLDFMDNAFGESADTRGFVVIPGAAVRFNVPWTPTIILWQWSMFISPMRYIGTNSSGTADAAFNAAGAGIQFRSYIDGTAAGHTLRSLPHSLAWSNTTTSDIRETGGRNSCWFDMAHLSVTGDAEAAIGYHDLTVQLWMEVAGSTYRSINILRTGGTAAHNIYNRCTVGIRNARALVVL